MKNDNVLDSIFISNESNHLLETIDWWERKRIIFNIFLLMFEVIMVWLFWPGAVEYGIGNTIFWSIAYTIAANIFYSVGWGIQIISQYYKMFFLQKLDYFRLSFFILGTAFSVLLTIVVFKETLVYYLRQALHY